MRLTIKLQFIVPVLFAGFVTTHSNAQTSQPKKVNPTLTANSMINLYDAFGKREDLFKDFGFSTIVNYKGKIILFDAGGHAGQFGENAKKLGIDLKKIDMVVISHAHPDHLNGLDYLLTIHPKVKIYFPEDMFYGAPFVFDATGTDTTITDSLPKEMQYYKSKDLIVQSGRFWKANIEYVKENREILPGIKLVVTHSPYMGYFSKYPKSFISNQFEDSTAQPEEPSARLMGLNELSLSMTTDNGEILVVGCAHSSVEKIIEATKTYTNNEIALVFGGFHMIPFSRQEIYSVGRYILDSLKVKRLAPAHCTGHLAFKILKDLYGSSYVYAGAGEKVSF